MAKGKRNQNPKGTAKKKPEAEAGTIPVQTRGSSVGDNVTDEVMTDFERKYSALREVEQKAKDALKTHCKNGEGLGINLKVFKRVQKKKELAAPEAEAEILLEQRYSRQLGLFDAIAEYRQGQDNEDNEASVRIAEGQVSQSASTAKEQKGDLSLEAAYSRGEEIGLSGKPIDRNPHEAGTKEREYWDNGWKDGAGQHHAKLSSVDAANSAKARGGAEATA